MMNVRPWMEMGLPWWVPLLGLAVMIALGLAAQLLDGDRRDGSGE